MRTLTVARTLPGSICSAFQSRSYSVVAARPPTTSPVPGSVTRSFSVAWKRYVRKVPREGDSAA